MTIDRWRTPEADAYRKLYKTKQWRHLREAVLLRDMFRCARCKVTLVRGRTNPRSAVVHHIEAHKGDPELFFDVSNLASACKKCHDGHYQSVEVRGYDTTIGEDGWPPDPNHPANLLRK